jgi:hypothetical protein
MVLNQNTLNHQILKKKVKYSKLFAFSLAILKIQLAQQLLQWSVVFVWTMIMGLLTVMIQILTQ